MKDKILVLGGTEFVGRQLVERLIEDPTNEIFLFNRGKTNPELFPAAHKIIGDRNTNDVAQLKEHQWDYVIDFSAYYPESLRNTLRQLNSGIKRYIYISTISVYALKGTDSQAIINEDFEKVQYTEEDLADKSMKTYGKQKMACEDVLNEVKGLNKVILRPSVIYGKYDPTDRFYYWVKKIKEQDKLLLPDNGKFKFSLTAASDLVEIIIAGLKGDLAKGTYNCNTHSSITVLDMMREVRSVLKSDCKFVPVDRAELRSNGVALPFCFSGDILLDNTAIKKSLPQSFRPFKETIEDFV